MNADFEITPILNVIDSRNDQIGEETIKVYENRILRRLVMKKEASELKAWIASLGVKEGQPLRLRVCKNFVRGICNLTEVSDIVHVTYTIMLVKLMLMTNFYYEVDVNNYSI